MSAGRQLPTVRDVFSLYCSMTHGTTVKDLCTRFSPSSLRIDERKLVQFGILEGFIRRVNKVSNGRIIFVVTHLFTRHIYINPLI